MDRLSSLEDHAGSKPRSGGRFLLLGRPGFGQPGIARLKLIAPGKDFSGAVIQPLRWAATETECGAKVRAGITTQFVVGAAGESDREILSASSALYRKLGLRRAYYSPFRAAAGTPLENTPPPPPERSIRLYQADWLLREYGFNLDELPFETEGELPTESDPKLAWARRHPEFFPVEINRAVPKQLLRVPGIGRRGVEAIMAERRRRKIADLAQVRGMRLPAARIRDFVTLDGKRPAPLARGRDPRQMYFEI